MNRSMMTKSQLSTMPRNRASLLGAALLCAAGLTLSACELTEPGDDPDAAPMVDDFTAIYNSASFQTCANCHAPGAPGFVDGTEATQDWTDRETAYQSLQGMASGLIGNFMDCNGVPFIGETPETSLLLATFDDSIRTEFTLGDFPDCNTDTISDMTLKIGGPLSDEELQTLTRWLANGAPDM